MTQPDDAVAQPASPSRADGMTWLIRQALLTLTPFFLDGAGGDTTRARAAARELLAAYQIGTAEELQLATECIAFAYSALDTLRQAQSEPDIPATQRLRLHNTAAALNRASHCSRRTLDARRRFRAPLHAPPPAGPEPPPIQAHADPSMMPHDLSEKIARHRERMAGARVQSAAARSPTATTAAKPFMNREQRRTAELASRREDRRAVG